MFKGFPGDVGERLLYVVGEEDFGDRWAMYADLYLCARRPFVKVLNEWKVKRDECHAGTLAKPVGDWGRAFVDAFNRETKHKFASTEAFHLNPPQKIEPARIAATH
jgi:hypothetical protein